MVYRRVSLPGMWNDMDRLQREMNQFFNTFAPARIHVPAGYPALNLWAKDDVEIVTAELPGVDMNDIELNVTGNTLTLSGVRKPETTEEGAIYHRRERDYGQFTRTIQLSFPVEVDKVEATFDKGILRVVLPRQVASLPKKISVKNLN